MTSTIDITTGKTRENHLHKKVTGESMRVNELSYGERLKNRAKDKTVENVQEGEKQRKK